MYCVAGVALLDFRAAKGYSTVWDTAKDNVDRTWMAGCGVAGGWVVVLDA